MQLQKLAAVMATAVLLAKAQHVTTATTIVVVDVIPAVSTSTAYATQYLTVLGCPPWELDCPVRHSVAVVTATTALSTTVCPLTLTSQRLSMYSTTVLSTTAPNTTPPLDTTTTTHPGTFTIPPLSGGQKTYEIPSSVWGSLFPSGLPSSTRSGSSGDTSASSAMTFTVVPPLASSISSTSGISSTSRISSSSTYSSLLSLSSLLSWSTSVSIHQSVVTLSNGRPSVTISEGSLTIIVPANATSTVPAYVPYPLTYNSTLPPNATFVPTGTRNSTLANATSLPYTSSGSGGTTNLFSIAMALFAVVLIF